MKEKKPKSGKLPETDNGKKDTILDTQEIILLSEIRIDISKAKYALAKNRKYEDKLYLPIRDLVANDAVSLIPGCYAVFAPPRGGKTTLMKSLAAVHSAKAEVQFYNLVEPRDATVEQWLIERGISVENYGLERVRECFFNVFASNKKYHFIDSARFTLSLTGYPMAAGATPTVYNLLLTQLHNYAVDQEKVIIIGVTPTANDPTQSGILSDMLIGSCGGVLIPEIEERKIYVNYTIRSSDRLWHKGVVMQTTLDTDYSKDSLLSAFLTRKSKIDESAHQDKI